MIFSLEKSICKTIYLIIKIKSKYIPISGYLYRTGIAPLFDANNSYMFRPNEINYYRVYRNVGSLLNPLTMVISQTKCPIFELSCDHDYSHYTFHLNEITHPDMINPILVKYK